jgi:outer membrane receptor protein involved in Fe transport
MTAARAACAATLLMLWTAGPVRPQDTGALSLEDLLKTKITTATKTQVSVRDAPAALTVITRADIQRYGYRNLTEALARVPEVHTHYQGFSTTADFRGFWQSDINRRILYLVNGQKVNDPLQSGDFDDPGVFADLSNVERIEIIRGPGAALYGTVAVLGVVNVITRAVPPDTKTSGDVSVQAGDFGSSGSFSQKVQASIRHRLGKGAALTADLYWFDEELTYDTHTQDLARPWTSTAAEAPGIARVFAGPSFLYGIDADFASGTADPHVARIPNGHVALGVGDWTLGAFAYSRRASQAWPLASTTFAHPDSRRGVGVGSVFLEWKPKGKLERWDLSARVARTLYGSDTRLDFSNQDFILGPDGRPLVIAPGAPPLTLAGRLGLSYVLLPAFLSPQGERYGAGSGVDPSFLSPLVIDAKGGGVQDYFVGLDKSWSFEAQASPVKSATVQASVGVSVVTADFENLSWNRFRDGTFHSWTVVPQASSSGSAYGVWGQLIWTPLSRLTLTAGSRFDRQDVDDVHLHVGQRQVYLPAGAPPTGTFVPAQVKEATATDFTPRLAANWSFSDQASLRVLYAEAFRAVPPDEIIRLQGGHADSERTRNYEAILSVGLGERVNVTANAFRLEGNVLYGGNYNSASGVFQYGKGSGWNNTGGSLVLQYRVPSGIEAWLHASAYRLRKPTDFFPFVRDYKQPGAPPLPTMYEPLDSPTLLLKSGASYRFLSDTTVSAEVHVNGPITTIVPVDQNVGDPSPSDPAQPNFLLAESRRTFTVDLSARQELAHVGLRGGFVAAQVRDLLDGPAWGVLNQDQQQTWDRNTWAQPNQLPGFGRRLYVQAGYRF